MRQGQNHGQTQLLLRVVMAQEHGRSILHLDRCVGRKANQGFRSPGASFALCAWGLSYGREPATRSVTASKHVKPADLPAKWTDLLDTRWKGKLGVASIDAGGTSFAFWFFMRQRYGIDAWRKLAAQNPRIGYSVQPVMTDLARGETAIVAATIDSLIGAVATGSPVKIILPPAGPAFGLYGGIASTAPHPHAAAVWMNWITSEHVAPFLSSLGLYSIRRDAPVPQVAGVKMPGQSEVYNIRASDYLRAYAPQIKERHTIFGAH